MQQMTLTSRSRATRSPIMTATGSPHLLGPTDVGRSFGSCHVVIPSSTRADVSSLRLIYEPAARPNAAPDGRPRPRPRVPPGSSPRICVILESADPATSVTSSGKIHPGNDCFGNNDEEGPSSLGNDNPRCRGSIDTLESRELSLVDQVKLGKRTLIDRSRLGKPAYLLEDCKDSCQPTLLAEISRTSSGCLTSLLFFFFYFSS